MPYKVKRPSKTCDIEQLSQALRLKLQELGQLEAENSQLPTCSNGSSSANGSGCAPEGYAKMTLRQLQEDYQETVNQLAQHLSFMDNPFKRNQQGDANPFVNIKRLLSRHGCMLTQLVATGQEHLVPQFMMADCVTRQQQEQHNEALYEYALQRLELSAEQQQRIQATLMCFQGLLAAIVEERQAIQSELCPQGMPAGPGGSNGAAAPPAAAAAPAEAAPPRLLKQPQPQQQQQQQQRPAQTESAQQQQ
ncbi:hypothetical protein OEZ86_006199 [Tetradesmus obliquus]|nr:hypothetical protein OEZ86_006199 [Tetradesmus obliquus]